MPKIPFTVSARAARLIGRENISTPKGAIIELVKNAYDADSQICLLYFDNKYSKLPVELSLNDYNFLTHNLIAEEAINEIYTKNESLYTLRENIEKEKIDTLTSKIKGFSNLYIIDNGEGMTQKIIKEHWMIIGTDNKSINIFTKDGRVKAGAKGIGRFALDKLGDVGEMTTKYNSEVHKDYDDGNPTNFEGYKWKVDWRDFEGEFKPINKVEADLDGFEKIDLQQLIKSEIEDERLEKIFEKYSFNHGTILKISGLRDEWEDFFVEGVFSDLEVLLPPKETDDFNIFLFSSENKNKYGEITGSVCDDYDFKIVAKADENQNVKITIFRNEYDVEAIDSTFFEREELQNAPYTKEDFKRGFWKTEKTFSQLLPGYKEIDKDDVFKDIGVFEFTLYFMKKTYSTPDARKFFYKRFMSKNRIDWLKEFGGIKLFRDNFRVRPYGETKNVAFDWLELGQRKSASPAGIGKEEGGYRVEPDNVAGAIKISRLTNVDFEDVTSREGLQESKTFQIFKKIITGIIAVFEKDRAFIARELSNYWDEKHAEAIDREKAEQIAKRILEKVNNQSSQSSNADNNDSQENPNEIVLAELNRVKDEEIETLKDEQKILRGLASSGIVIASFSHDLSKLSNVLNSRIDKLKELVIGKIDENDYANVEERKNPFVLLERMKKQDLKLQNWLQFSLGTARKDKRRRKILQLNSYFSNFVKDWATILENRGITLDLSRIENLGIRVFEIDIDSIFNNLLINSIDAFNISTIQRERTISIEVNSSSTEIFIDYRDSGPGLSKDIDDPEEIFKPLFTTKRNKHTGDEEGTGLGMWLVDSIVKDNDGLVKLLYPQEGFGLRITFPVKTSKE